MNRFELWNEWRKRNLNGDAYKLLVLLGFVRSPTFEFYRQFGDYDNRIFKDFRDAIERLPEAFWALFYGELVAIICLDVLQIDPDCKSCRAIDYIAGTSGWNVALWSTCKRLGLMDFYEWYDGLNWMESDGFDSVLSDELVRRIEDPDEAAKDAYYLWLMDEKETNDKN